MKPLCSYIFYSIYIQSGPNIGFIASPWPELYKSVLILSWCSYVVGWTSYIDAWSGLLSSRVGESRHVALLEAACVVRFSIAEAHTNTCPRRRLQLAFARSREVLPSKLSHILERLPRRLSICRCKGALQGARTCSAMILCILRRLARRRNISGTLQGAPKRCCILFTSYSPRRWFEANSWAALCVNIAGSPKNGRFQMIGGFAWYLYQIMLTRLGL